MIRKFRSVIFIAAAMLLPYYISAQSDPFDFGDVSFNEDDLFGGSDDDMFGGSLVEEWNPENSSLDPDLAQGILFKDGSVKIGGSVSASFGTQTNLLDKDYTPFGDSIEATTIDPSLSATLYVDARPNQSLRMYGKMALSYPFESYVAVSGYGTSTVTEYFKVKELFTDFSVNDSVFFRFGLHTVSWGTGYFYSPASDLINTSSIDPENTDAQVSGSLNLRAQIPIKNTQNCLWLYIVPPNNSTTSSGNISNLGSFIGNNGGASISSLSKLNETSFGGKYEFLVNNWELGVGAMFKYHGAPKAMTTFSGTIINGKVAVFGEGVYQYGSSSEWSDAPEDWYAKTNILYFTAGGMYNWKALDATIAAQYYYNGNRSDLMRFYNAGHNIALMASFANLFDNSKLSATFFGMINIGHDKFDKEYIQEYTSGLGENYNVTEDYVDSMNRMIPALTLSGTLSYSPFNSLSFSGGPYLTMASTDYPPEISFKLNIKLGGGNF